MKHNIWDSLYHGATLKHKCGKKRIVALPLFIYFLFLGLLFFFGLFFLWGQCSNNDDHHTFIYLQLNDYNSILKQSMTLYGGLRRCTGICNESRVTCIKIMNDGSSTNTMSITWLCKQYDNDEACHNNRMVESCMAIYIGMDMEMP